MTDSVQPPQSFANDVAPPAQQLPTQPADTAAPASTQATTLPAEPGTYRNDELVYVDPDAKTVVGRVEWSKTGNPKSMLVPKNPEPTAKDKDDGRKRWRKNYPFGTYKSMKNAFKLEGKQKKGENTRTLEEILPIALEQAFWD